MCLCEYMVMYIYIILYIYIYIYIYIYMFKCAWVSVYIHIYTYACILVYFFFDSFILKFFSYLSLSLIFVLTWGTTMKVRRFCPFCTIPTNVDTICICLQYFFNFNFCISTFNQFFFFFYVGQYSDFTNFVIFELYLVSFVLYFWPNVTLILVSWKPDIESFSYM